MINVLHSKYADQLKIRISDMQKETFEVEYEYEGERLDKYVSILFPLVTFSNKVYLLILSFNV